MNEKEPSAKDTQIRVVAYCRVSTDKTDQLNSLETQKEFFTSYCMRNHLTLVHTYADEGISGTRIRNRTEFQKMMRDAQKGVFEQLIVKDVSRLARNTVDLLQSVRRLRANHIETVFITSDMKTLGNSEFVLTLMGAMAQEESSNTSKRVKFGKKENAKKGRVPNLVYGYDKLPGEYFQLTINQSEATNVRRIYEWYVEEGYGAASIASLLNQRGIKTKRNCRWSQNAVSRILQNELYIGQVVNGKEEVADFLTGARRSNDRKEWIMIKRPELAIITDELYSQAQQVRMERNKRYHSAGIRQSNKYIFSTLIRCETCGYSFRRIARHYRNSTITWVCSGRNANGTGACDNAVRIGQEQLQREIYSYIESVLGDREYVLSCLMEEYHHMYYEGEDRLQREHERKSEIARLTRSRDKYKEMYLDDLITREELARKMKELNEVIRRDQEELDRLTFSREQQKQMFKLMDRCFTDCGDLLMHADIGNEQMKKIVRQITVCKDGNVKIDLQCF